MKFDRRALLTGIAVTAASGQTVAAKPTRSAPPLKVALPFAVLPSQGSISELGDIYSATALGLSRQAALTTRCVLDIPYGKTTAQRLDIYLPDQAAAGQNRPVLINIHGGAWRWGYKEWMGLNAPPIVASGAIYITIGYTLVPDAQHPTQLNECIEALAWVYANITAYGGNPDKILIGGHSAGAHLASLVALRSDLLTASNLPANVIKGCLLASGAYDFRDPGIYGLPLKNPLLDAYLKDPGDAADASPIMWVEGNAVPFLVTWGENDRDDARFTAPAFLAALRRQTGRTEAHMFPKMDHTWMHLAQQSASNAWTKTAVAWLHGNPHLVPDI